MSVSLASEKEPLTSLETSSWLEASWLQPGTALAQAFKGFLTGRPLHQCSPNFLQGLQLHQDYCSHKGFSTWAGQGRGQGSLGHKVGPLGGVAGTGQSLGGQHPFLGYGLEKILLEGPGEGLAAFRE